MKFKISNVLLLITLICVCLAWWVDRRSQLERLQKARDSAAALTQYSTAINLAEKHRDEKPDEFAVSLKKELVFIVLTLFRDRDNIQTLLDQYNAEWGSDTSTEFVVGDTLKLIGCTTADEYFELLRTLSRGDWVQEYSDPQGESYEEFHEFVRRLIGN